MLVILGQYLFPFLAAFIYRSLYPFLEERSLSDKAGGVVLSGNGGSSVKE